jgi:hypothetical protein
MRSARVTPNTIGYPSDYNALLGDAAGGGNLLAHQMFGTIALPTNPSNGQTLTFDINGNNVVITFVTAIGSAAGNVLIAATAAGTLANLIQLLLNPTITNSTQVAIGVNTSVNVTLINYINWSASGTNLIASSFNSSLYAPASSFSASTTVTSGTYTANTMALYVEPGVVYVNGTRVIFAGASAPTVTAPSSHPRIDVLTIDNTGTLAWTTGTEASSPSAPAYPADKVALCELYNVVGETALYDNANQANGQGYILNDVRPILGLQFNPAAISDSLLPDADGTRNLGSPTFEWNNIYAKSAIYVNGLAPAITKFGGTGTDGALSITSGTTTIACGSASYVEKNYTSISITGTTAKLAFSGANAIFGTSVTLRSQGNVTITSSNNPAIDITGMGGGPGNAVKLVDNGGSPGAVSGAGGGSTAAAGTSQTSATFIFLSIGGPLLPTLSGFERQILPGGNGDSGAANGGTQGTGGRGGGGLYIECAGAYNCTATINAAGANGNAGTGGGGTGGGGAGGNILVLYATLTADSGTYTVTAGTNAGAGSSLRIANTYHA